MNLGHCLVRKMVGNDAATHYRKERAEDTLALMKRRLSETRVGDLETGDSMPVTTSEKRQLHSPSERLASSEGRVDVDAENDILGWIEQIADTDGWS